MKKFCLIIIILCSLFFTATSPVNGQLQCDECGYCVGQPQPGNWDSCRACIYEGVADTLSTRETTPGNFYTQLGCIKTGVQNPFNTGASGLNSGVIGGVANFLLNKFLFPLAGVLSFLYIIYGAYLLITSQDDPERKLQGRGTVTGAIVGVIFTLLSVFLVNFIAADVLKIPGFAKGPQIVVKAHSSCAPNSPDPATAPCVYPKMEIWINNKVVKTFNEVVAPRSGPVKVYPFYTSEEITDPSVLSIRFVSDQNRTDLTPKLDRNLFIREVSINNSVCNLSYYGKTGIKMDMWYSGYAICATYSN